MHCYLGGITLQAGLPERRLLPRNNFREQRTVCHIIMDFNQGTSDKTEHPIQPNLVFFSKTSPFSSTHFPYTESVGKKFKGFSMKILNVTNCHNNYIKAGRKSGAFFHFTLLQKMSVVS